MFILHLLVWFVISCIVMSFIEHQVHSRLMHKNTKAFNRAFLAHAGDHHKHYSSIFTDEPVPLGEDKEIRLTCTKSTGQSTTLRRCYRLVFLAMCTGIYRCSGFTSLDLESNSFGDAQT